MIQAGAEAFSKVNWFLFFALVSSILVSLGSLLFGHTHHIETLLANSSLSCHILDPDIPPLDVHVDYYRPRHVLLIMVL